MSSRIVDTNVWVAASGGAPHMGEECTETCFEWFETFKSSWDLLVIDADSWGSAEHHVPGTSVIGELKANLGPGSYGLDLLNHHFMPLNLFDPIQLEYGGKGAYILEDMDEKGDIVDRVDESILPGFEPNDRKWIALHLKHPLRPPIHNAADGDWIKAEEHLRRMDVKVVQLCECQLRKMVEKRRKGKK